MDFLMFVDPADPSLPVDPPINFPVPVNPPADPSLPVNPPVDFLCQ